MLINLLEAANKRRATVMLAATLTAFLVALARWYKKPSPPPQEGKLIDRFLPNAEFCGEVSVKIRATPQAIFRSLAEVTLNDMPLARWIGELRYLPARLMGKSLPASQADKPFMDLVMSASGNIVLALSPYRELVLGSIGKFHDPADQQFVALHSPQHFLDFDDPAYQKLAMSFRVSDGVGGSAGATHRFTLEHRTHALSPASRAKFALYWLGIKPGGNLVSWLMLRAIKRRAEAIAETTPETTDSPLETREGVAAYSG